MTARVLLVISKNSVSNTVLANEEALKALNLSHASPDQISLKLRSTALIASASKCYLK